MKYGYKNCAWAFRQPTTPYIVATLSNFSCSPSRACSHRLTIWREYSECKYICILLLCKYNIYILVILMSLSGRLKIGTRSDACICIHAKWWAIFKAWYKKIQQLAFSLNREKANCLYFYTQRRLECVLRDRRREVCSEKSILKLTTVKWLALKRRAKEASTHAQRAENKG